MLSVAVSTKNQISGNTYDAAGNMIFAPGMGSYAYDAENRMTSAAGVSYSYDGDGKRVAKSNGKLYWYSSDGLRAGGMSSLDALVETDAAGNNPTEYIFFGGKRIARRDPNGSVFYFFADHLGSARVVTNATGQILDDSDFYPFGGERAIVNNDPNPYKFTGKERDAESGLDYFGARYYSPSYGRFLSPDEFTGGPVDAFSSSDPLPPDPLPYADISNPQSLNKYVYTYNNPLNYIDPDGHCPECIRQTILGATTAFLQDNGIPVATEGNSTGRAIGHVVALVQGISEVVAGVAAVVGGSGEALVTAPVAATGVPRCPPISS